MKESIFKSGKVLGASGEVGRHIKKLAAYMDYRAICLIVIVSIRLCARADSVHGVTYYIDGIDGSNSYDGLSIETPFAAIQQGINQTQDGDTVIVLPGVYEEDIHFQGKNIVLTSVNPEDPAVVDSTCIGGDWVFQQRRESVVQFLGTEKADCVLQGFRIFGYISGCGPDQTDGSEWTHAAIMHCVFKANCGSWGTVIENCDGLIKNCVIADNYFCVSMNYMPAIRSRQARLENCTIINNQKGLIVEDGGNVTLVNCIIAYNPVYVRSGGKVELFYNNIFHAECRPGPFEEGGQVYWVEGNISSDPNFVSPGFLDDSEFHWPGQDYHLQSSAGRWDLATYSWVQDQITSPCIDAGNPGTPIGQETEPSGSRVNMGAYGGTPTASKSPAFWRMLSDIDNDMGVGMEDFSIFAKYWQQTDNELPADLDRNGTVDLEDLFLFTCDWCKPFFNRRTKARDCISIIALVQCFPIL